MSSARTRILFLIPSLVTGGAETQLRHLVTGLDRNEFEPIVWCPGSWGAVGEALQHAGVLILRDGLDFSTQAAVDERIAWLRGLRAAIFFSYLGAPFWPDVLLANAAEIPIRITRRGNMRHWDEAGVVTTAEHARNAYTDAVVSCSQAAAELAIAVENLPREKVTVIPSGVPDAPVRSEPAGMLIGNVSNARPVKGHSFLFEAFRRVRHEIPTARLTVVGRLDDERVGTVTERRGVAFTGELADPNPVYRQLSLYVQSSLSESLSLAILEAMSHGLPVVATDVGGTAEAVVKGETGLLVPPGDAGALARAILELLRNPSSRARLGRAGRERACAEYSINLLVGRHEQLFRNLLSRVR